MKIRNQKFFSRKSNKILWQTEYRLKNFQREAENFQEALASSMSLLMTELYFSIK